MALTKALVDTINNARLGYATVYFADDNDLGRGPEIIVEKQIYPICEEAMEELMELDEEEEVGRLSGSSFHHIILLVKREAIQPDRFHQNIAQPGYAPIPWVNNLEAITKPLAWVLNGSRRVEFTRTLAAGIMKDNTLTPSQRQAKLAAVGNWHCVVYDWGEYYPLYDLISYISDIQMHCKRLKTVQMPWPSFMTMIWNSTQSMGLNGMYLI
jgi:hypothetical protein